jgi:hypothetical protein
MITSASPVIAVTLVVTGTGDVIFHPSLLSSRVIDVKAVRRYYNALPL